MPAEIIKSQPMPAALAADDSMSMFLEDINGMSRKELAVVRKHAYLLMKMKRFTREELKLIVGHTDWLLKRKEA